jgi:hypothetical protein
VRAQPLAEMGLSDPVLVVLLIGLLLGKCLLAPWPRSRTKTLLAMEETAAQQRVRCEDGADLRPESAEGAVVRADWKRAFHGGEEEQRLSEKAERPFPV